MTVVVVGFHRSYNGEGEPEHVLHGQVVVVINLFFRVYFRLIVLVLSAWFPVRAPLPVSTCLLFGSLTFFHTFCYLEIL